jgi:hypothetical protein
MATNEHIIRAVHTMAEAVAGMEDGQSVLLSNANNEHLHRIGSNFYSCSPNRSTTDGVSFTYKSMKFTTAICTDLAANTIPKHKDDTDGLVDSQITDDGTDVFIAKSLHIGATSGAAGDDNLLVDGSITQTSLTAKVIPTASTAGLITNSNIVQGNTGALDDDATVNLSTVLGITAANFEGFLFISFSSHHNDATMGMFAISTGGTSILISSSGASVDDADTDDKLCVYASGGEIIVKNRLGANGYAFNVTYFGRRS